MKIYKTQLIELNKTELNKITKGVPIEERIKPCPKCKCTEWWLLPRLSASVRTGGKHYCECLECGYQTHL